MTHLKTKQPYSICVIDVGSPKLGNIGWCYLDIITEEVLTGQDLDDLVPIINKNIGRSGLLMGLEAPLFVPLRSDLMLATKGRKGEGRRPWSAGAGAQVLAMNLPIMSYLFQKLKGQSTNINIQIDQSKFKGIGNQMLIFEALVSGVDKGHTHIDDARIMTEYCSTFSRQSQLPPSILEKEDDTQYFNLAAAALLRCGFSKDLSQLNQCSPIYKPSTKDF